MNIQVRARDFLCGSPPRLPPLTWSKSAPSSSWALTRPAPISSLPSPPTPTSLQPHGPPHCFLQPPGLCKCCSLCHSTHSSLANTWLFPQVSAQMSSSQETLPSQLVYFWCLRVACGILVPPQGFEPAPPVLEARAITTAPPGKSPGQTLFKGSSLLLTSLWCLAL